MVPRDSDGDSILFGVLWLFWLRFVPAENARIYNDTISSIRSIRICPEGSFPLVSNTILVTNKASIQEIMTAIRSGQPCFVNHPATKWQCMLIISNATGIGYLDISSNLGQGTVFGYPNLRNDKLAGILEKAVGQNSTNDK